MGISKHFNTFFPSREKFIFLLFCSFSFSSISSLQFTLVSSSEQMLQIDLALCPYFLTQISPKTLNSNHATSPTVDCTEIFLPPSKHKWKCGSISFQNTVYVTGESQFSTVLLDRSLLSLILTSNISMALTNFPYGWQCTRVAFLASLSKSFQINF